MLAISTTPGFSVVACRQCRLVQASCLRCLVEVDRQDYLAPASYVYCLVMASCLSAAQAVIAACAAWVVFGDSLAMNLAWRASHRTQGDLHRLAE